ncbi:hypothetical protein GMORB2_6406 [Geosmithia morbida]|uniref:Uncharacterized protein n=1 Tax=Geosmithia morbida TaxID=1094350 RepID=A0A9P4YVP9_9HYPO|nr:uncharacterized protein GMORB2_6406 [Geosmithia morbida]KAF4123705.1 hypothetical protein GMORB2_6406 [Geosmithia morbida]
MTGKERSSKQFLGQVWDGVRGVLGLSSTKKDSDTASKRSSVTSSHSASASASAFTSAPTSAPQQQYQYQPPRYQEGADIDRPSREEVLASYHSLPRESYDAETPGPSRGTKRAAIPAAAAASATSTTTMAATAATAGTPEAQEETGGLTVQPHRKLRKTSASGSRDMSIPKLRRAKRSVSAQQGLTGPTALRRSSARLDKHVAAATKRVIPPPARVHAPPPHAAARYRKPGYYRGGYHEYGDDEVPVVAVATARPLRVVRPDVNRGGVPAVPDIPPKFDFGEDDENRSRRAAVRA